MKSNKALGVDRVSEQMIKAEFSQYLEHRNLPDWRFVKVPKKGDLTVCDNWGGIMLLCSVLKVLRKIQDNFNRVQEKIDARQAGSVAEDLVWTTLSRSASSWSKSTISKSPSIWDSLTKKSFRPSES